MIFNSIYLSLDPIDYGNDFSYEFKLRSRWLCDYVERQLRKEKFRTEGFNRLSIRAAEKERDIHVNPCQVLCVTLPFDKERYSNLSQEKEYAQFYIDMLRSGVAAGSRFTTLPTMKIESSVLDFEQSGYSNRWIHKRRLHRKTMIYGQIECSMSMDALNVDLTLERKKKEIWRKNILTIDPDENIYWHKFKDVVFDEDSVTVTGKFSQPLFSAKFEEIIPNQSCHTTPASAPR